jgi:Toprim-like/CHC2 zinc finger
MRSMKKERLQCQQANQIDLVDYLATLGHRPSKIRNQNYWYPSPLRVEKEPSFKVDRKLNLWYDFGIGEGGSLIDFGKFYFNCSVKELLNKLENDQPSYILNPFIPSYKEKINVELVGKITIKNTREIAAEPLLQYLQTRRIPLQIAKLYCSEVDFMLYGKMHTVIGFENRDGGYELRNKHFKLSSSPKNITLIGNESWKRIKVFEGFFNFLSFQALRFRNKKSLSGKINDRDSFLILNSLSFFEKARVLMEQYEEIHLYLDNDLSGSLSVQKAVGWSNKYKDKRSLYKNFKDINDLIVKSLPD